MYLSVMASGYFIEPTVYIGRGVGERPTASAVIADGGVKYLAPPMAYVSSERRDLATLLMVDVHCEYYLRFMVQDESYYCTC